MKLVTLLEKAIKMAPEYIPGKCNIGARGRATRLATGVLVISIFLAIELVTLSSVIPCFRLLLVIPFYIGFLAALEGTMSFCVLHATGGTFDLREPAGWPLESLRPRWKLFGRIGSGWIEERRG